MKTIILALMLICMPSITYAEHCHQKMNFIDKWVVLPFTVIGGFTDAVSTIQTLERVEVARENGIIYKVTGITPTKNPEAFAYVRGGATAFVGIVSADMMMSCSSRERWAGRLTAVGHGLVSLWAAEHNYKIRDRLQVK